MKMIKFLTTDDEPISKFLNEKDESDIYFIEMNDSYMYIFYNEECDNCNIFCPRCGKSTDETGKFCQWCGCDIKSYPHGETTRRTVARSIMNKVLGDE